MTSKKFQSFRLFTIWRSSLYLLLVKNLNRLLANSRFYILAVSVLLSIFSAAYLRGYFPSDRLYYIRLEQIYGFISIGFLYFAVILTPLSKLLGKRAWLQRVLFARRAFGVSAAYFAALHVYLVMAEQIGGLSGLSLLPTRFKVSFALGTLALIILLLMAATSFDKAIKTMTFKNWKRLHRFVYLAGVIIIIHVWLIGTHAEKPGIQIFSYCALALLFGLESKRIGNGLSKRFKLGRVKNNLAFFVIFLAMAGTLLLLPIVTKNYHSEHHDDPAGMGTH